MQCHVIALCVVYKYAEPRHSFMWTGSDVYSFDKPKLTVTVTYAVLGRALNRHTWVSSQPKLLVQSIYVDSVRSRICMHNALCAQHNIQLKYFYYQLHLKRKRYIFVVNNISKLKVYRNENLFFISKALSVRQETALRRRIYGCLCSSLTLFCYHRENCNLYIFHVFFICLGPPWKTYDKNRYISIPVLKIHFHVFWNIHLLPVFHV